MTYGCQMTEGAVLNRLRVAVDSAVSSFYERDAVLVARGSSEWAMTHRLAVYLEPHFPGWNVDCEYNRQGARNTPKRITSAKRIRPDIIIHRRGLFAPEHNLLVVEIKKKLSELDLAIDRLVEFTSNPSHKRKFKYQFGVAICLDQDLKMVWVDGGKVVD